MGDHLSSRSPYTPSYVTNASSYFPDRPVTNLPPPTSSAFPVPKTASNFPLRRSATRRSNAVPHRSLPRSQTSLPPRDNARPPPQLRARPAEPVLTDSPTPIGSPSPTPPAPQPLYACTLCRASISPDKKPHPCPGTDHRLCDRCWIWVYNVAVCWRCGEVVCRADARVGFGWCWWHWGCLGCILCRAPVRQTVWTGNTIELKAPPLCRACARTRDSGAKPSSSARGEKDAPSGASSSTSNAYDCGLATADGSEGKLEAATVACCSDANSVTETFERPTHVSIYSPLDGSSSFTPDQLRPLPEWMIDPLPPAIPPDYPSLEGDQQAWADASPLEDGNTDDLLAAAACFNGDASSLSPPPVPQDFLSSPASAPLATANPWRSSAVTHVPTDRTSATSGSASSSPPGQAGSAFHSTEYLDRYARTPRTPSRQPSQSALRHRAATTAFQPAPQDRMRRTSRSRRGHLDEPTSPTGSPVSYGEPVDPAAEEGPEERNTNKRTIRLQDEQSPEGPERAPKRRWRPAIPAQSSPSTLIASRANMEVATAEGWHRAVHRMKRPSLSEHVGAAEGDEVRDYMDIGDAVELAAFSGQQESQVDSPG